MITIFKANDVFFNEVTKIIRKLKEAIDNLIKELRQIFLDNESDRNDEKENEKVNKYERYENSPKYIREKRYCKTQHELSKRHICIRNKYKH